MSENTFYLIASTLIGIIAFFLVRFWITVDEMRKDVRTLLVNGATRDEAISNLKKEVEEIKSDVKKLQTI